MISLCQQKRRQVPKENHGNIAVFEAACHVTFNENSTRHCSMRWLRLHLPLSSFTVFTGFLMFVSRFSLPYLLSEFHYTVRWGMSSGVVSSTSHQISGHVWWGVGARAKHSGIFRLKCLAWEESVCPSNCILGSPNLEPSQTAPPWGHSQVMTNSEMGKYRIHARDVTIVGFCVIRTLTTLPPHRAWKSVWRKLRTTVLCFSMTMLSFFYRFSIAEEALWKILQKYWFFFFYYR